MDRLDGYEGKQNKFVRNAAQTATLMVILTIASKPLGFIREMVMAGFFGTSYVVDAYVMAQSIPSIIFAGVFEAVATSYVPLLSEKIEKGSSKEGNAFTSAIINILLAASVISSMIGILFSDQITAVFAKGFTGETAELTSFFIKITFSYSFFSSTASILDAFLRYKNIFLTQIIISYTQNIVLIGTIIVSAFFSYYFLAFGLLISYAIKLFFMYTTSRKEGYEYSLHGGITREIVRNISVLAIPVFLGSSASQINLFIDKYLASNLAEGSIAALNYAATLNTTITSLTVGILITMIYPKLAQANATENKARFVELVQSVFNLIIIITLPFSLGAMIYCNQIVQIVLERGAFDVTATSFTASAYFFYSAGMLFTSLSSFFVQIYYSVHDMKTPMYFAIVGVIVNIVLNFLLVGSMQHNGLALATSISAVCNAVLLYVGLRKRHKEIKIIKNIKKIGCIFVDTGVSVGASHLIYTFLINNIWMPRMLYLIIAVLFAVVIYIMVLKIFKIEELNIIRQLFKK